MPVFTYSAVNQDGALVRGIMEAPGKEQAIDKIIYNGLFVVDISVSSSYLGALKKRLLYRKIKRLDIIEFVNNVSLMLRAGVPLMTALADLAETAEQKSFSEILTSIRRNIELGSSFSDALAEYSIIFPDILIRLAAVGEETGSLDKSLKDVGDHLQRIEDLVSAVKRALIYPIFALVTTGGALVFWLIFVLPNLMETFTGMGLELPFATLLLLAMSNFSKANWYLFLVVPLAIYVIFRLLKRSKKMLYYIDYASITLPIMHLMTHNKLIALFAEQLRILVLAGVTIDRSLAVTADVIGNEVFRKAILDTRDAVVGGNKISEALKRHSIFPHMVIRMIDIGEASGSLDQQLGYLSEHYLKKLDDVADKLSKMIEPLIIVIIGLIFMFIIVSLLFPVYDLVTKIG